MFDGEFKRFPHRLPAGHQIISFGQNLVPGYCPDIAIATAENNISIILESERKTERKAFIGALVKASHFAYHHEKAITLVFVMNETGNQTTVPQISENVRPIFHWLHDLGATQLNRVCLLSDLSYLESFAAEEVLLSAEFLDRCITLLP